MANQIYNENGYPIEQARDMFTRQDDLTIMLINTLKQLNAALANLNPEQNLNPVEIKRQVESGEFNPYQIITLSLDSARTDELVFQGNGGYLLAATDGSMDGITAKLNNTNFDSIPLKYFNPWKQIFTKLYLSNTAQSGKYLTLAIGKSGYAETYTEGASMQLLLKAIHKYSQNPTAELAATDICPSDIAPSNTPCLFRVQVHVSVGGVFSAIIKNGATTTTANLNDGIALDADSLYIFDVLVHSGDTVNFQTSVGADVMLRVQEIVGGTQ